MPSWPTSRRGRPSSGGAQRAPRRADDRHLGPGRGGIYAYTHTDSSCAGKTASVDAITVNKSGTSGSLINYYAYPGERPVFDFSAVRDDCRIKGFDVTGNYVHLKGLAVTGVRQNKN